MSGEFLQDARAVDGWRRMLGAWFAAHGRDLPWRRNYDPYQVWISEVMLQQTRMDQVLEYFCRWLGRFPDVAALAAASEDEVLKCWEGMGYYSRARNLLAAGRIVIKKHGGRVPADLDALLALPGIGPYTAAAIMSIAFGHDLPVVDANVGRVVSRLLDIDSPVTSGPGKVRVLQAAGLLLPPGGAREFNQALMELGALVCLPRGPRCDRCPVALFCLARLRDTVEERPVKTGRPRPVAIVMATGLLRHEGRIFIQKRQEIGVWPGLWEFPGGRLQEGESPEEGLAREYQEETGWRIDIGRKIGAVRHSYTIYRVTLHGYCCRLSGPPSPPVLTEAQEGRWVLPEELSSYAFPAGHRRLMELAVAHDPGFAAFCR